MNDLNINNECTNKSMNEHMDEMTNESMYCNVMHLLISGGTIIMLVVLSAKLVGSLMAMVPKE